MIKHQIATLFGIGYLQPAPGTWGSLAALPMALILMWIGGPILFVVAIAAVFVIGYAAAHDERAESNEDDPQQVVIDEVVGQWIALIPVAFGAWMMGAAYIALWPGWVAAFVLFRLFDIWKPGPVGWADRQNDTLGLMLDDVMAGAFAAIGVGILAAVAHGIMML